MSKIDAVKVAREIKKFINRKKFDLVDYSLVEIQCYPPPDSKEYPEIKRFSSAWSKLFDEADKAMKKEDESKYIGLSFQSLLENVAPKLAILLKKYDSIADQVVKEVNEDAEFWEKIRGAVIPLYEKSKFFSDWQKRWVGIKMGYDPVGLEATTTKIETNKKTGERKRCEIVSKTKYPPGFIVSIK